MEFLTILFTILFTILIVIFVVFVISCNITTLITTGTKYQSLTYKKLKAENFNKCKFPELAKRHNQVTDNSKTFNDFEIIWFTNRNDFKIGPNHYLDNMIFTYLSPYNLYWYIKYKKWFNKNCSHLKS